MESVQPIRDGEKLESMKEVLRAYSSTYYTLFVLGTNCGLRVSDLLNLKLGDVAENQTNIKEQIGIQGDAGHCQYFDVHEECVRALKEHLQTRDFVPEAPLFPSRKGGGPLKRVQVWKVLKQAAQQAGIEESIGIHSLRKTFAYHAYTSGQDISHIQKLLNHRSPAATLKYIGIEPEADS